MKILNVLILAGMLLSTGTARASFTDDFTRPDNIDIGNGWVKGGDTGWIDPWLVVNYVSWRNVTMQGNSTKGSSITKTFDAVNDVSVDLRWSTSATLNLMNASFSFYIESPNGQDHLTVKLAGASTTVVDWLVVKISCRKNGIVSESETGVKGCAGNHVYRVTMNDRGKTRVYIDGQEKWASGDCGIDACVKSRITAQRYIKDHKFSADNFAAINRQVISDANGDGLVDVGDLGILAANYGQSNKTWTEGDFNGDGVVDVGDLGILAANYGQGMANTTIDFNADYAKAFGTALTDEDADASDFAGDETNILSICSLPGLLLVLELFLMAYWKMD